MRVLNRVPNFAKGTQNNDEIGEPGSWYVIPLHYLKMNIISTLHTKARHKLKAESGTVQLNTILLIRESVDSLCRDGADAQYMQYLRKSRIISPQIR